MCLRGQGSGRAGRHPRRRLRRDDAVFLGLSARLGHHGCLPEIKLHPAGFDKITLNTKDAAQSREMRGIWIFYEPFACDSKCKSSENLARIEFGFGQGQGMDESKFGKKL